MQENLATLREEASEVGGGLPRHVERDFTRHLECGVLAHGFARVWCGTCKDDVLVAFSCKGRGVCPSCNARRAHVTAAHLVERVLPPVPYRQWTLSFPHRVRWVLPAAAAAPEEQDTAATGVEARGGRRRRTPRLDWAGLLKRTFKEDVLACRGCGGRRRVVAHLTHPPTVCQVLRHPKLPADIPPLAPARGPPQGEFWQ